MSGRPFRTSLVGLVLALAACTSYTQIGMGELPEHDRVRVTTTDGKRHDVREPRVEADSVKGYTGAGMFTVPDDPFSVPAEEVRALEAGGVSALRTGALVVGAAVIILSAVLLAFEAADLQ